MNKPRDSDRDHLADTAMQIDEKELAVRMIEDAFERQRPKGWTAEMVLDGLDAATLAVFTRAARAAVFYMLEQADAKSRMH